MKLGFFRSYDWIWKGALGPFNGPGAFSPFNGPGALGPFDRPAASAFMGPFPAKLIIGVRTPVDIETGMSVDLPLLDRKAQDLIRLLSFSLATEVMPDIEALLANILRRFETGLKAESQAGDDLQIFHLELRLQAFVFKLRDGVFSFEQRVRAQGLWPAGSYFVACENAADLRETMRIMIPREASSDLDRVFQLSQHLKVPVRYRDWRSAEMLSVR